MSKKLSLKQIREKLAEIDVYEEINVKKLDKSNVRFLIIHNRGFISFETGPRIAKKLLEEIKYVKAYIKIIAGFDASNGIWNGIVLGKPPRDKLEWFEKRLGELKQDE